MKWAVEQGAVCGVDKLNTTTDVKRLRQSDAMFNWHAESEVTSLTWRQDPAIQCVSEAFQYVVGSSKTYDVPAKTTRKVEEDLISLTHLKELASILHGRLILNLT